MPAIACLTKGGRPAKDEFLLMAFFDGNPFGIPSHDA